MSLIKFICAKWIATSCSRLKNSLLIGGCGTRSRGQVHREIGPAYKSLGCNCCKIYKQPCASPEQLHYQTNSARSWESLQKGTIFHLAVEFRRLRGCSAANELVSIYFRIFFLFLFPFLFFFFFSFF